MRGRIFTGIGFAIAVGLVYPALSVADEIRLKNGVTIQVEAWRDVGDAIEFSRSGGIIRISKTEIERIDGKPTRGDLRMYSAPPSASAAARDQASAGRQMTELLKQGEALFEQAVLAAPEKVTAFRRLGERWGEVQAPEALREAHARGQRALQMATEAYTAESEGKLPDVKERIEAAKAEIQGAQVDVRKGGGEQG